MGLLGTIGGLLGGSSSASAARKQAEELRQAGQQAFEASRFRPVGMTTRFGTSNFTVDPTTGALTSAGYTASPELAAIQNRLLSQAGGQGLATTEQALAAQQGLFNLGQQYLAQSPEAAAQQWMQSQQAVLAPGREQAWSNLRQADFNRGTTGLKTAQGGTLEMANPYASALANAQAQQDLQLAAQAQQQGRAQTQFGAGLFGTGIDVASAGYNPLKQQFGMVSNIEQAAQQPLTLGMDLGKTASGINTQAAQLRFNPQTQAAAAQFKANSWNPWAAALGGLDQSFSLGSLFGSSGGTSSPSYQYNAPYYASQMAGVGQTGGIGLMY